MFAKGVTVLCLLFALFFCSRAIGQEPATPLATDTVFELIDPLVMPVFPGGETALMKYLAENVHDPVIPVHSEIPGSLIVVSFVVLEDGSISDVRILKDIGFGYGAEVARVVGLMPKWRPGQLDGKPVRTRFTLPFRVCLK